MKVVLAVALLALLAIGVDATAQRLGALPANSLALTSSDIFTASGFTITLTKNQGAAANYVGDGTAILETKFNVTWTGYLPPTATGVLGAIISFSGAGGVYQSDSSCTGGLYSAGAGVLYGNFLSFDSTISPRFLAAGTATATVSLYYPPSVVAATATFTFPVITPFVPATGNRPTISAFTLASTFTGVNAVAANVTLANQGTGANSVTLVFTASNNNQGVAWVTAAVTTNGVIGNDAASWSNLAPYLGSWCGDSFSGFPASGIDFALGTMLTIRSVSVSNTAGSTSYGAAASFLTGNNAIAVAGGDTDVTPPTCQGAAFATPTDVATAAVPITKALVLACSDNMGGSGLEYTGAFLRAQSGSITYDFASENFNTANEINVPLHYSGSVNVIGVWSMDGAGNTVVYGSCGNALTTGAPESVCGEGGEGSSSSAVIASISVVIACILAVLAL